MQNRIKIPGTPGEHEMPADRITEHIEMHTRAFGSAPKRLAYEAPTPDQVVNGGWVKLFIEPLADIPMPRDPAGVLVDRTQLFKALQAENNRSEGE